MFGMFWFVLICFDMCLVCGWYVFGTCVARVWCVFGMCLVCVWYVLGMCLVCVWYVFDVFGMFLACFWYAFVHVFPQTALALEGILLSLYRINPACQDVRVPASGGMSLVCFRYVSGAFLV